jgi:hypothetical protein
VKGFDIGRDDHGGVENRLAIQDNSHLPCDIPPAVKCGLWGRTTLLSVGPGEVPQGRQQSHDTTKDVWSRAGQFASVMTVELGGHFWAPVAVGAFFLTDSMPICAPVLAS